MVWLYFFFLTLHDYIMLYVELCSNFAAEDSIFVSSYSAIHVAVGAMVERRVFACNRFFSFTPITVHEIVKFVRALRQFHEFQLSFGANVKLQYDWQTCDEVSYC